jgi:hypothetical protein
MHVWMLRQPLPTIHPIHWYSWEGIIRLLVCRELSEVGFGPRNRGNHTKFVKRHFIRNSSDGSTGIYSLFSFHKQLRPARHKNTWCLPVLERSLGIAAYNRTDFRFARTGWNGIDLLGRHYFRFLYLAPPRESKGYCSCRAPPAPARAGSQLVPSNVSVVVSPVVHLCGYLSVCIGVCNNKQPNRNNPNINKNVQKLWILSCKLCTKLYIIT